MTAMLQERITENLQRLKLNRIQDIFGQMIQKAEETKSSYNGGSAATASHFAQDMGEVGRKINGKGFSPQY